MGIEGARKRSEMTTFLWCMAGWALGWIAFGRPSFPLTGPVPSIGARQRATPAMSIVIPARDEQHTLPLLLSDLQDVRPAGSEVIVVDDASSDETGAVAERFPFVTVVRSEEPPPGWFGKPWACQLGADQSSTPLLCFLDADVRLGDGALELMAREAQLRGGLVSVQPWHATRRPYEQASALFNVISVMGVGMGARLGGSAPHPTGAFGPAMMTMRADYDHVGGHASVAAEIVEDIALARAYRCHDREVSVLPGRGLVSYRMYPLGLRSLIEGWTKNFALGAIGTPLPVLVAVFAWLAAMGTTVGYTLEALDGGIGWWGPVAVWAAFSFQLSSMFKVVGSFGRLTAIAFPLLLAVFFLVFFRSLWFTLVRRKVRWRGRTLALGPHR